MRNIGYVLQCLIMKVVGGYNLKQPSVEKTKYTDFIMSQQTTIPYFEAVVIGASAGGIRALSVVLSALPADFGLPILVVQHIHPNSDSYLVTILGNHARLLIKQADEKEPIEPNTVYLAPPGYHMLVEDDRTISFSLEAPVKFARPSIDVLFDTAVDVYRNGLIGVILTGANNDGAEGCRRIKQTGGYVIAEDPTSAETPMMPKSAIAATTVDQIIPLPNIGPHLVQLINHSRRIHRK